MTKRAKKNRTKKRTHKKIKCLLVALCLLTLPFMGYLADRAYARYTSQFTGSGSVDVASFAFGCTKTLTLTVNEVSIGAPATFEVTVNNMEGSRVSEVGLNYTISASHTGHLPIYYTITPSEVKGVGSKAVSRLWANDGYLSAGVECQHTYTVTVYWDEMVRDTAYLGGMEFITLEISAVQAQPMLVEEPALTLSDFDNLFTENENLW